jgi:hypothetical protein
LEDYAELGLTMRERGYCIRDIMAVKVTPGKRGFIRSSWFSFGRPGTTRKIWNKRGVYPGVAGDALGHFFRGLFFGSGTLRPVGAQ